MGVLSMKFPCAFDQMDDGMVMKQKHNLKHVVTYPYCGFQFLVPTVAAGNLELTSPPDHIQCAIHPSSAQQPGADARDAPNHHQQCYNVTTIVIDNNQ